MLALLVHLLLLTRGRHGFAVRLYDPELFGGNANPTPLANPVPRVASRVSPTKAGSSASARYQQAQNSAGPSFVDFAHVGAKPRPAVINVACAGFGAHARGLLLVGR